MPRTYRKYNDDDIRAAVKNNKSIAGVLRELHLQAKGGNFMTMKLKIAHLKLDVTHFTGQLWNKGFHKPIKLLRNTKRIKLALLQQKGHKCEKCKLSTWMDKPIPIELEHINGNSLDHSENNLLLLCPNCHAQTSTYRRVKSSL